MGEFKTPTRMYDGIIIKVDGTCRVGYGKEDEIVATTDRPR